jgi:hypothetical protein
MRLLVPLLALALGACAFTDVPLRLPSSVGTGLRGGDGRVVIVRRPFKDARADAGRCGMQKNEAGNATAKAVCSEEPAAWLAGLLATELSAAGFTVVEASDKPSAVQLEGTLAQFFVEPLVLFSTVDIETDVKVTLVATSATGLVADRTFYVKGIRSSAGATAANFQKSVEIASQQIARDLVAAVLSLMNRYPELGTARRTHGGVS